MGGDAAVLLEGDGEMDGWRRSLVCVVVLTCTRGRVCGVCVYLVLFVSLHCAAFVAVVVCWA